MVRKELWWSIHQAQKIISWFLVYSALWCLNLWRILIRINGVQMWSIIKMSLVTYFSLSFYLKSSIEMNSASLSTSSFSCDGTTSRLNWVFNFENNPWFQDLRNIVMTWSLKPKRLDIAFFQKWLLEFHLIRSSCIMLIVHSCQYLSTFHFG